MEPLGSLLEHLGGWGLVWFVAAFVAYLEESEAEGPGRVMAALRRRWVMATSVAAAFLAWAKTWSDVLTGDGYLRGFGLWTWFPWVLIVGVLTSAGVALAGLKVWPRFQPWLTYLIAVTLILGSKAVYGSGPEESWNKGDHGEGVLFVQQRLESLHCVERDADSAPVPGKFDDPTVQAVFRFQLANGLLMVRRDFSQRGVLRREPEFRKLANPFGGLRTCAP